MSLLSYDVLKFINRVKQRPSDGSDPTLLKYLEQSARNAFEGAIALMAPITPNTYETKTVMVGSVQNTNRISFQFPRPCSIVGFYPSIVVLTNTAGLKTPSTDTIDVQLDVDNETFLTSGAGVASSAGNSAGNFVTLTSMGVQTPRLLDYKLRNPTPVLGVTYRWKEDVSAGAIYQNAFVCLSIFARFL